MLILQLYCNFLEIESPGQVIDGDLVIQGVTLNPNYGPVICLVDFALDSEENFTESVAVVHAWEMMFAPVAGNDENNQYFNSFAIPIRLEEQYRVAGSIKVRVYADEISSISYSEEIEDYHFDVNNFIFGIELTTRSICSKDAELETSTQLDLPPEVIDKIDQNFSDGMDLNAMNETSDSALVVDDATKEVQYVKEVRICLDFDELQSFRNEGFDVTCIALTPEGIQEDQEYQWKFFVAVSYGSTQLKYFRPGGNSPHSSSMMPIKGLEDIMWVKCLKSMGTMPTIPHFEIHHDTDLTNPDDDVRYISSYLFISYRIIFVPLKLLMI